MTTALSTLGIVQKSLKYEVNGNLHTCPITEFLIDGQPLAALLGIERSLGSSECDLDRATTQRNPTIAEHMIGVLTAQSPPFNQFGTNRTVLYRCHCGCDYCGVFSCLVVDLGDLIEWRDISFEDDEGPHLSGTDCGLPNLNPIARLTFDKADYVSAINKFVRPMAAS